MKLIFNLNETQVCAAEVMAREGEMPWTNYDTTAPLEGKHGHIRITARYSYRSELGWRAPIDMSRHSLVFDKKQGTLTYNGNRWADKRNGFYQSISLVLASDTLQFPTSSNFFRADVVVKSDQPRMDLVGSFNTMPWWMTADDIHALFRHQSHKIGTTVGSLFEEPLCVKGTETPQDLDGQHKAYIKLCESMGAVPNLKNGELPDQYTRLNLDGIRSLTPLYGADIIQNAVRCCLSGLAPQPTQWATPGSLYETACAECWFE